MPTVTSRLAPCHLPPGQVPMEWLGPQRLCSLPRLPEAAPRGPGPSDRDRTRLPSYTARALSSRPPAWPAQLSLQNERCWFAHQSPDSAQVTWTTGILSNGTKLGPGFGHQSHSDRRRRQLSRHPPPAGARAFTASPPQNPQEGKRKSCERRWCFPAAAAFLISRRV